MSEQGQIQSQQAAATCPSQFQLCIRFQNSYINSLCPWRLEIGKQLALVSYVGMYYPATRMVSMFVCWILYVLHALECTGKYVCVLNSVCIRMYWYVLEFHMCMYWMLYVLHALELIGVSWNFLCACIVYCCLWYEYVVYVFVCMYLYHLYNNKLYCMYVTYRILICGPLCSMAWYSFNSSVSATTGVDFTQSPGCPVLDFH